MDRHGTGRVLFRNTRAAIPGFPGRVPSGHPYPCRPPIPTWRRMALARLTPEAVYGPAGRRWTRASTG